MPAKSEKQRRAMYAAAAGHSTVGIPAKVGREFTRQSPRPVQKANSQKQKVARKGFRQRQREGYE